MKLNPRARKEQVDAELAADARYVDKAPPTRRKIDGKYYYLRYISHDNRSAETHAQDLREGRYEPPCHVRVFDARDPRWEGLERYLIYARPRPLTEKERASSRKPHKKGPIRGTMFSALFGRPDPVALAKFRSKVRRE